MNTLMFVDYDVISFNGSESLAVLSLRCFSFI